ncbi:MAG: type II toxin-antitoxin system RelE/ParE family toxin [Thiohalocapsa sp.]
MRLRFTPRAAADLIAIAEYIRARNPGAALAVRDAILGSLQTLCALPGNRPAAECRGGTRARYPQVSVPCVLRRRPR